MAVRYRLALGGILFGMLTGMLLLGHDTRPELPVREEQQPELGEGMIDYDGRAAETRVKESDLVADIDELRTVEPGPFTLVPEALSHRHYRPLDDLFAREPVDGSWANSTEARIFDSVTASEMRVVAINAECRTTICAVELALAEEYSSQSIIQKIISPVIRGDTRLDHLTGFYSELPDEVESVEKVKDSNLNVIAFYMYREASLPPRSRIEEGRAVEVTRLSNWPNWPAQ